MQFEQSVKVASGKSTKILELLIVDIGALDGRRHNERVEIDLKNVFIQMLANKTLFYLALLCFLATSDERRLWFG